MATNRFEIGLETRKASQENSIKTFFFHLKLFLKSLSAINKQKIPYQCTKECNNGFYLSYSSLLSGVFFQDKSACILQCAMMYCAKYTNKSTARLCLSVYLENSIKVCSYK